MLTSQTLEQLASQPRADLQAHADALIGSAADLTGSVNEWSTETEAATSACTSALRLDRADAADRETLQAAHERISAGIGSMVASSSRACVSASATLQTARASIADTAHNVLTAVRRTALRLADDAESLARPGDAGEP